MSEEKNLLTILGEWWDRRNVKKNNDETNDKSRRFKQVIHWLMPNGGTLLLVVALILTQQVWAGRRLAPKVVPL
jgi:hypothetical protein